MALRKFTEEQAKEAKRLRADGLSFAEIGRQMGMTEQSARYLALRADVAPNRMRTKVKDTREAGVEYFRHDRYYM